MTGDNVTFCLINHLIVTVRPVIGRKNHNRQAIAAHRPHLGQKMAFNTGEHGAINHHLPPKPRGRYRIHPRGQRIKGVSH
ncbi:hypothetical protein SRABI106_04507 [Rahnella aquatilis]|nr:hypothetical protein SRABI106_04507 [Rahnella aquatilis]